MGDSSSAVKHFEESVEILMKLPLNDLEVIAHWFLLNFDVENFLPFCLQF